MGRYLTWRSIRKRIYRDKLSNRKRSRYLEVYLEGTEFNFLNFLLPLILETMVPYQLNLKLTDAEIYLFKFLYCLLQSLLQSPESQHM